VSNSDANGKLARLVAHLGQIASGSLREVMIKAIAEEAVTQVKFGFEESRNPYGVAWQALKHRKGKPLLDTGRLRNSFTYELLPTGFRLGTNVVYARFHQYGTGGRKAASSRLQVTTKKGKFITFAKAGKKKKGAVYFRRLHFQAGTGGIPARPMVPEGTLGPIWESAFNKAGLAAVQAFTRRMK